MRKFVLRIRFLTLLAAMAALTLLMTSTQAVVKADNNHSEQIIFSGVGTFTSGSLMPPLFGFWVWCQNESSGNGIYNRDKACQGAMYVYAMGLTKGVLGFGANGGVVEDPSGTYTLDVHSADMMIRAKLKNAAAPVKGPKNTVNVEFTAPGGDGTSTNALST